MTTTVHTASICGITARRVTVTFDPGGYGLRFDGPDTVAGVRETRMRVRAALARVGVDEPYGAVTLSDDKGRAVVPSGCHDLAIADAIAWGLGKGPSVEPEAIVLGELSLGGDVRSVRGVLPMLLAAKAWGFAYAVVPLACADEAAAAPGIACLTQARLSFERDALTILDPHRPLAECDRHDAWRGYDDRCGWAKAPPKVLVDAYAATVAAVRAGKSVLLIGSPGAGKTMLARRVPEALGPMTAEERLEVASIHSAAGLWSGGGISRPFRAPHHTCSAAGLMGGGDPVRPGEACLASHGVLFLDEVNEFRSHVLEGTLDAVRRREITVTRRGERYTMPVLCGLIAAANPCPCGYLGHPRRTCQCSPARVAAHEARLAAGRFDVRVEVPAVPIGA